MAEDMTYFISFQAPVRVMWLGRHSPWTKSALEIVPPFLTISSASPRVACHMQFNLNTSTRYIYTLAHCATQRACSHGLVSYFRQNGGMVESVETNSRRQIRGVSKLTSVHKRWSLKCPMQKHCDQDKKNWIKVISELQKSEHSAAIWPLTHWKSSDQELQ